MGNLLVFLRDGIAAWLPLFFAVLLVLMVYILWRTLQVMPRVTAAKTITSTSRGASSNRVALCGGLGATERLLLVGRHERAERFG